MKQELTPKETEYMEYLETPMTTRELMEHFRSKENAVWQIMRTLRLKKLAHRTWNGFWKMTEDGDDVPPITVTPLQTRYIKYLRVPHSTKEMMIQFNRKESAVQQVTRTLRLMGYVEPIGRGAQKGKGGCWHIWGTTEKGLEAI